MIQYAKTHGFYIVLIIVGIIAFRMWLTEHDSRQQADTQVKTAEIQVKDLQAQIQSVNATAAKQVQVVVKTVAAAKTPVQIVRAVPQLTNIPLNARVSPVDPTKIEVDSQPFVELLGQCKLDSLNLGACQKTEALQTRQLSDKDTEINALRAKPKFWAAVKRRAKEFGIDGLVIEGLRIALTRKP